MLTIKAKKIINISIVAILMTLIALTLILYCGTGPHSGRVIDPFTNQPLAHIKVVTSADSLDFLPESGSLKLRYETVFTDESGVFHFPFHFGFIPVGAESFVINPTHPNPHDILQPDIPENPNYFSDGELYWGRRKYSFQKHLVIEKFFRGRVDYYLIPKVDSLSACDKIDNSEARERCVQLNIPAVAVKNSDPSLCSLLKGDDEDVKRQCGRIIFAIGMQRTKKCDCESLFPAQSVCWPTRFGRYPEPLMQIKEDSEMCKAYCSWYLYCNKPLCSSLSSPDDQAICSSVLPLTEEEQKSIQYEKDMQKKYYGN